MNRLDENSNMLAAMDKKMDLHIQETKFQFKAIQELDEIQNAILDEHHKRSDRLAEDNALREAALRQEMEKQKTRIEKLEAPGKWWETTKKWFMRLGALAGVAAAIYELIQMLGK